MMGRLELGGKRHQTAFRVAEGGLRIEVDYRSQDLPINVVWRRVDNNMKEFFRRACSPILVVFS